MSIDPSFTMPTATEPPRDPATPRPIDEARQQREENVRQQRAQEIRSTALQLAVSRLGTQDAELYRFADQFAAYIADGTKPTTPAPPTLDVRKP